MATAKVDLDTHELERNVAYFRDTLIQVQCHKFNWDFEKVPHVILGLLIGDIKQILKCVVFLKDNRVLLLLDDMNITSMIDMSFMKGLEGTRILSLV